MKEGRKLISGKGQTGAERRPQQHSAPAFVLQPSLFFPPSERPQLMPKLPKVLS